jgi:hypothetical protein
LFPRSTANSRTSTPKSQMPTSVTFLYEVTARLYGTTNHLVRKHSRVSLLAAGAATVGLVGGTCSMAVAAPWHEAAGNIPAATHGHSLGSPPLSDASARDVFGDAFHASHAAPWKSAGGHGPTPAKSAPGKPTAPPKSAKSAAAKATTAHVAKTPRRHAPKPAVNTQPSKPYLVYDSVSPGALPAGQSAAVYANGAYAVPASQVAGHHSLLWIDTNGSDPSANVLDVEPGDSTPDGAAHWVNTKLRQQPHSVAIVYTMTSEWQAVKDRIGGLPSWMRSHVRYWIADPTGVPHVVPGSDATQWYWGSSYDISTANPDFEH